MVTVRFNSLWRSIRARRRCSFLLTSLDSPSIRLQSAGHWAIQRQSSTCSKPRHSRCLQRPGWSICRACLTPVVPHPGAWTKPLATTILKPRRTMGHVPIHFSALTAMATASAMRTKMVCATPLSFRVAQIRERAIMRRYTPRKTAAVSTRNLGLIARDFACP